MKKILINALYIKWGINGGTEVYLSNVVRIWYLNPAEFRDIAFTIVCSTPPPWWEGDRPHFRLKIVKGAEVFIRRFLYEQFVFPFITTDYDSIFQPAYVTSIFTSTRQVLTVPDAFAWRFPGVIGRLRTLYWRIFIPLSVRKADRIISISHSTAKDLNELLGVAIRKIVVVHLAGDQLGKIHADPTTGQKLQIAKSDFFLTVGFFKKIKNPFVILEAYQEYRKLVSNPKKLLLIGGIFGEDAIEIKNLASTIEGIIIGGRVDDSALKWLYQNSAGLIFVSLYEGFGIPILEAQRLGCPVITASNSSMPEVAGDGAILLDDKDAHGLANAMTQMHSKEITESLIEKGRLNELMYTWEITADKLLKVLVDS